MKKAIEINGQNYITDLSENEYTFDYVSFSDNGDQFVIIKATSINRLQYNGDAAYDFNLFRNSVLIPRNNWTTAKVEQMFNSLKK
jgi:hypothetical protein